MSDETLAETKPRKVAKDMRTACTIDGVCLKQRSKIQQESDDVIDADDEDDHLIEASASDVDEE